MFDLRNGAVAMTRYGLNKPGRGHLLTKVVMCICGQSIVAVNKGRKWHGFKQTRKLQLLKTTNKNPPVNIKLTSDFSAGDRNKFILRSYQVLPILLIDGDQPALCGAFFAGLFDADVSDIMEVAQCLQLLKKQYIKKPNYCRKYNFLKTLHIFHCNLSTWDTPIHVFPSD